MRMPIPVDRSLFEWFATLGERVAALLDPVYPTAVTSATIESLLGDGAGHLAELQRIPAGALVASDLTLRSHILALPLAGGLRAQYGRASASIRNGARIPEISGLTTTPSSATFRSESGISSSADTK